MSTPAGIACPHACTATYELGTKVTLVARPVRGSRFAGWRGGCRGRASACRVDVELGTLSAVAVFRRK
jgi:Divergent InlB B-repeat domain